MQEPSNADRTGPTPGAGGSVRVRRGTRRAPATATGPGPGRPPSRPPGGSTGGAPRFRGGFASVLATSSGELSHNYHASGFEKSLD